MAVSYQNIITIEPGKRGGQPCIRGMRITVYDVLSYLASGIRVSAFNFVALDTDKKLEALSEYQFFIQNWINCRK